MFVGSTAHDFSRKFNYYFLDSNGIEINVNLFKVYISQVFTSFESFTSFHISHS